MTARRPRNGGFTLIEVIVVIAVISILASMAVPFVAKILDQSREEATRKQLQEMNRAILGDPTGPTAGYVGDMGRRPATLDQLNTQGGQQGVSYGPLGVKYGWSGPYVNVGFSPGAYLVDGWGTNLNTLLNYNAATGQITSYGANRVLGGGDDITYPSNPIVLITGRLLVNLYVWDNSANQYVQNPTIPGTTMTVRMYYSNNGLQAFKAYTVPTGAPLVFSPTLPGLATALSTHAGFHEVTATCTLPSSPATTGQAVVFIHENNQQTVLNLYLR